MAVKFEDYSVKVKAAINDTTIQWLYETASDVASEAKQTATGGDDTMNQVRRSYAYVVNEGKGEAQIGSSLEGAFWEEFGTGEYADTGKNGGKKGREGWWVYIKGQESRGGGKIHRTKEEAEDAANYLRTEKNLNAYVTKGRRPNYTLENAFKSTMPEALTDLNKMLKEMEKRK